MGSSSSTTANKAKKTPLSGGTGHPWIQKKQINQSSVDDSFIPNGGKGGLMVIRTEQEFENIFKHTSNGMIIDGLDGTEVDWKLVYRGMVDQMDEFGDKDGKKLVFRYDDSVESNHDEINDHGLQDLNDCTDDGSNDGFIHLQQGLANQEAINEKIHVLDEMNKDVSKENFAELLIPLLKDLKLVIGLRNVQREADLEPFSEIHLQCPNVQFVLFAPKLHQFTILPTKYLACYSSSKLFRISPIEAPNDDRLMDYVLYEHGFLTIESLEQQYADKVSILHLIQSIASHSFPNERIIIYFQAMGKESEYMYGYCKKYSKKARISFDEIFSALSLCRARHILILFNMKPTNPSQRIHTPKSNRIAPQEFTPQKKQCPDPKYSTPPPSSIYTPPKSSNPLPMTPFSAKIESTFPRNMSRYSSFGFQIVYFTDTNKRNDFISVLRDGIKDSHPYLPLERILSMLQIPFQSIFHREGQMLFDNFGRTMDAYHIPSIEKDFIDRKYKNTVKELLIHHPIVALSGKNGKTITLLQIAHDHDIQNHFHDGIMWADIGLTVCESQLKKTCVEMINKIGDTKEEISSMEEIQEFICNAVEEKYILIILDNLQSHEQLEAFQILQERCPNARVLFSSNHMKTIEKFPFVTIESLDRLEFEKLFRHLQLLKGTKNQKQSVLSELYETVHGDFRAASILFSWIREHDSIKYCYYAVNQIRELGQLNNLSDRIIQATLDFFTRTNPRLVDIFETFCIFPHCMPIPFVIFRAAFQHLNEFEVLSICKQLNRINLISIEPNNDGNIDVDCNFRISRIISEYFFAKKMEYKPYQLLNKMSQAIPHELLKFYKRVYFLSDYMKQADCLDLSIQAIGIIYYHIGSYSRSMEYLELAKKSNQTDFDHFMMLKYLLLCYRKTNPLLCKSKIQETKDIALELQLPIDETVELDLLQVELDLSPTMVPICHEIIQNHQGIQKRFIAKAMLLKAIILTDTQAAGLWLKKVIELLRRFGNQFPQATFNLLLDIMRYFPNEQSNIENDFHAFAKSGKAKFKYFYFYGVQSIPKLLENLFIESVSWFNDLEDAISNFEKALDQARDIGFDKGAALSLHYLGILSSISRNQYGIYSVISIRKYLQEALSFQKMQLDSVNYLNTSTVYIQNIIANGDYDSLLGIQSLSEFSPLQKKYLNYWKQFCTFLRTNGKKFNETNVFLHGHDTTETNEHETTETNEHETTETNEHEAMETNEYEAMETNESTDPTNSQHPIVSTNEHESNSNALNETSKANTSNMKPKVMNLFPEDLSLLPDPKTWIKFIRLLKEDFPKSIPIGMDVVQMDSTLNYILKQAILVENEHSQMYCRFCMGMLRVLTKKYENGHQLLRLVLRYFKEHNYMEMIQKCDYLLKLGIEKGIVSNVPVISCAVCIDQSISVDEEYNNIGVEVDQNTIRLIISDQTVFSGSFNYCFWNYASDTLSYSSSQPTYRLITSGQITQVLKGGYSNIFDYCPRSVKRSNEKLRNYLTHLLGELLLSVDSHVGIELCCLRFEGSEINDLIPDQDTNSVHSQRRLNSRASSRSSMSGLEEESSFASYNWIQIESLQHVIEILSEIHQRKILQGHMIYSIRLKNTSLSQDNPIINVVRLDCKSGTMESEQLLTLMMNIFSSLKKKHNPPDQYFKMNPLLNLLQPYLQQGCSCMWISHITPYEKDFDDNIMTLKFSHRLQE